MRCRLIVVAWLLCVPAPAAADRLVDTAGRALQKPSLYLYTAAWCEPCRRLQADLDEDRDFKAAVMEKFVLRAYDYEKHKANAMRAGVKALPSFFTADSHWEGYKGKEDLARRLQLNWQPRQDSPPVPAPPDAAAVDVRQALESSYERWLLHEKRFDELGKQLEDQNRSQATILEKARQAAREVATAVTPANDPADEGRGSALGTLVTWGLSQLGWTLGPIGGVAVGVGVPFLYRLLTQRRPRRSTDRPRGPAVVAVDTPPDDGVVTRTEYVPYVDQTLQDALAWAMKETTRKYPGAVNNLEFFQGLIDQYLSGVGRDKQA